MAVLRLFGLLQQSNTSRVLRSNRNSFLTVLETETIKSEYQHDWVLVRALYGLNAANFSLPYVAGRE
jgi:hypothetical protein